MFYRLPLNKAFFAFLAVIVLLSSCKENTVIRTDVVPAVDNITVFGTDTLTLWTKSVKDDTVKTSVFTSGIPVFLGAGNINNDAYFGKTAASFYFQVRPPQDNYSFDQNKYQIDSAILILPYSGFSYGDTTFSAGTQTFKAYRMTESIFFDSVYYAHSPAKSVESSPIATKTVFLPDLFKSVRDSTRVAGINRPAHLRMRLEDNLMNQIMIEKTGGSDFTNTAAFLNYFKGIFITTETGGNTIVYFRLTGDDVFSKAGILMYYHTKNSGGIITDTLSASFPFDPTASQTKTASFNRVTRDYSGSPVQSLFTSTAVSENTITVQNLPGAAIDLRIPYIKNLPRCIVNKAELVITQIPSPMDAIFALPIRVYPEVIEEDGSRRRIADRNPTTSTAPLYFMDGNLRTGTINGTTVNQYVLNFPRELQNAIVEQKKELRLRINGTQSFIGAYRLTAAGSTYSQPAYRIKLNVVYTKL
ncbi:MAG: DUF4270 family protein [Chitinophagaceae bacterium]